MKSTAKVFAKINLNLKITGLRGKMHTLDGFMHSVGLFDTVMMTVGECGVYMNGEPSPNNIVCKVVDEAKKLDLPPLRFDIEKGIPMEAGLGGSSADAACALRLIEREFGEVMNPLAFGSDVHFMTTGGLSRVRGVGEDLTDFEPLELNLVIAKGRGGVSTPEAYRAFDESRFITEKEVVPIVKLLREGNFKEAKEYLFNDLQSVSEKINPEVKRVREIIQKFTPLALMSGSGSSVFGIFESEKEAKIAQEKIAPFVEFASFAKTQKSGIVFEN